MRLPIVCQRGPAVVRGLLAICALLAAGAPRPRAGAPPPAPDRVLAAWSFANGPAGWRPGPTASLRSLSGCIEIRTDGRDPILIGPPVRLALRDGDLLEVRMAASRRGEIQWFWRTDAAGPYGGFSGERQRLATVSAGTAIQTVRAPILFGEGPPIIGLRFDLPEGDAGVYRIESMRVVRPANPAPAGRQWSFTGRAVIPPPRIDIARTAPPATRPVAPEGTVAMWYFAAWEPEYNWDGWAQVAERAPYRIPLLYDSGDSAMEFNGIRFYRSSSRRAVDWHVHWMREHAVNLMLWDWYPEVGADGRFSPAFFGNRALELGFLGKGALGGPPVPTNRFADAISFAVMWTNHAPGNRVGEGFIEYLIDQLFRQPNYYRIDGKPFLPLWSPKELADTLGGRAQAKAYLERIRQAARERGFPGVYIAAVNGVETRALAREYGLDGVMGYCILGAGGYDSAQRRSGRAVIEEHIEDFRRHTLPGHQAMWDRLAREFGRDFLLPTTPMQNWEPTLRPTQPIIAGQTPDDFRAMLAAAKATVRRRRLRPFISVEAFNEWLEGSYVEPGTQWGLGFLEAIRDILRATP